MNSNLVHVACVIDRSGSMSSVCSDAIGGFNTFLEEQKKGPGEAVLTLVLFDHEYLVVHDAVPVASVAPLDETTYVPRGNTALLDAIGRTIDDLGARLAAMPEEERPGGVIVAILTDGHENSSLEYTRRRVAEMIEHQRTVYNWSFVFLAADQDAIDTAEKLNIDPALAMRYASTAHGTRSVMRTMSSMTSQLRGEYTSAETIKDRYPRKTPTRGKDNKENKD